MEKRTVTIAATLIAVGLVLSAVILLTGRSGSEEAEAEVGAFDYPRGPHGARLLSDSALQLEVTIYETGVPPQFRIYPFDAELKPVPPGEVTLQVELHRL